MQFQLLMAAIVANLSLVANWMGSDGVLDVDKIQREIGNLRNKGRVFTIWQSLESSQLDAFIRSSHALVQPFVLIPSEIPLAIIECMAWGKPVIITNTEGSGQFAELFGLLSAPGNIKDLAGNMLKLLENDALYAEKSSAARKLYENHPTWHEVALAWLDVGQSLVA